MAARKADAARMITDNGKFHFQGFIRENLRPSIRPLEYGHPPAVQVFFDPCRKEFGEALQAVDVHVKQGGPAGIIVDQGEGRAGDDRVRTHAETSGDAFRKPRFSAPKLTHEGNHVSFLEQGAEGKANLDGFLIRFRDKGEPGDAGRWMPLHFIFVALKAFGFLKA